MKVPSEAKTFIHFVKKNFDAVSYEWQEYLDYCSVEIVLKDTLHRFTFYLYDNEPNVIKYMSNRRTYIFDLYCNLTEIQIVNFMYKLLGGD